MLLVMALQTALAVQAAPAHSPEQFKISVSGIRSGKSIELRDGKLICSSLEYWRPVREKASKPSAQAWKAFRAELDQLAAWDWEGSYVNPQVEDGTQCSVSIRYSDKFIESSGRNQFPGDGRSVVPPGGISISFRQFIASVGKLSQGCRLLEIS